jgi:AcrR family transcriptional regulator
MAPRVAADVRPGSVRAGGARERLVTAARALVEAEGLTGLTVGSICEQAGLSRATFYVHFATRDDVLLTLFLEEAAVVIGGSGAIVTEHADFGELCVEALVSGLDTIRASPVLRVLFSDEQASVATRMASTSQAFLAMAYDFWEPVVIAAQERGEVRAGLDASAVVRWFLRVFLSYLEEDPAAQTPADEMRQEVRTFLLPAFLTRPAAGNGAADPEADHLLDQLAAHADLLRVGVDALRAQIRT